ncbi:hypothetical protein EXIGLDRAFT_744100 [Exidia glandulosa HHB12029]|uniref:Cupredoxin n=1 Tax=Exidia glandulosa HHB12029 TaxID=1314781 RepID=A0A165Q8W4_EXIGL|nr:hypothetical protein EXIGLDRAFT_744100 [Exidia glandulosa HHB12029]
MRTSKAATVLVFFTAATSLVAAVQNTINVTGDASSWQHQDLHGAVGDTFSILLPQGFGHSLMQVSFDSPCAALAGGFNTGVSQKVATNFTVQLTDMDPIYIACGEPGHCHAGEVSTINAPATSGTQALYDFVMAARGTPEDTPINRYYVLHTNPASPSQNSGTTQLDQSPLGSGVHAMVIGLIALIDSQPPSPPPAPPSESYPNWVVGVAFAVALCLLVVGTGVVRSDKRQRLYDQVVIGKRPA